MKNKISYQKTIVKEATFHIFGTEFTFNTSKKNLKMESIVPFLSRHIVETQLEWTRKDQKNVILFYKTSQTLPGSHMSFVFAVEADEYLMNLQKEQDKSNIPKMIQYMFENRDKLNFNI